MANGICQSQGLDLVNIIVYAKFQQNIADGSRDMASFTFLKFGPRQSLFFFFFFFWQSLWIDLVNVSFIKIFLMVQNIPYGFTFSEF